MTYDKRQFIDDVRDLPLQRRTVTQLCLGLETMLENLPRYQDNATVYFMILDNYQAHTAQLKSRGFKKMAGYYERQVRRHEVLDEILF